MGISLTIKFYPLFTFPKHNLFLDFSPEPSLMTNEALIQQLQAQGMSVKTSSGNET